MRRSNRHHASTAAADASVLPKSPTRTRSGAETKPGTRSAGSTREAKSSTSSNATEPRRQRAAAVAAKDAMTLIANNGLTSKEEPKSSAVRKEVTTRLGKRATASSTGSSSATKLKVARTSEPDDTPVAAKVEQPNEEEKEVVPEVSSTLAETLNSVLDVTATIPHDLSHFPRELTVKEVIAKTMRVNRVSTRGLSRDIVGLMKDMRNEEKAPEKPGSSEAVVSTGEKDKDGSGNENTKNSLDAVIDGVLSMARKPSAISLAQSQLASAGIPSVDSSTLKPKRQYVRVRATSNGELYVNGQLYAPTTLMNDSSSPVSSVERVVSSAPVSLTHSPAESITVTASQPLLPQAPLPDSLKDSGHPELKAALESLPAEKKDVSNSRPEEVVVVDVIGDSVCASQSKPRELNVSEKVLIINDFDEGMLPHELEQKFNITKLQVAEVLKNRIPIIRQQASSLSDRHALKRRRTNFVGLNLLMWRFFCDCRDQGIVLNGRQLKEHALSIARQLGLHNFKGSEGWLDSFKRRHNIDLKTMTGQPVIYEAESDLNGFCLNETASSSNSAIEDGLRVNGDEPAPLIVDANQFLIDATDEAAKSAEIHGSGVPNLCSKSTAFGRSASADAGPCQATAAVHTTQPLDLARMLPSTSAGFTSSFSHPSSDYILPNGLNLSSPRFETISAETVQALIETCLYRADEPEVSRAIETLRSYITMTDISLLPLLVNLQKGLTSIAAKKKSRETNSASQSQVPEVSGKSNPAEPQSDSEPCTTQSSSNNTIDSSFASPNCRGPISINSAASSTPASSKNCHEPTFAGALQNLVPQISIDPISHSTPC